MCIGSSIIGVCSYLVQYQTILSHSVWKSLSVVWIIYHKTKHNGEKKTRNSTKHGLSHCEKEMCARNFICSSILSLRHVFMFLHWFFSFILHWLSLTKTLFFMVGFFFASHYLSHFTLFSCHCSLTVCSPTMPNLGAQRFIPFLHFKGLQNLFVVETW